jgi:amino acid transporter
LTGQPPISARQTDTVVDRPSRITGRPVGSWSFTGVALTALGPLGLAALLVPGVVADASPAAGLATVGAAVLFAAPLVIWLRYSRQIASAGGLYAFTVEAAGRRIAMIQAGLWITSYLLYLIYTTAQIVYDVLPVVLPAERRYQPVLEIAIPVALAAVLTAGRRATLIFIGLLAAGQVAIAAALAGVTIAHLGAPAASFGTGASTPAGTLATATGQTALLYVCGSLPLFLGGEVVRPRVTMRRGLIIAYVISAVVATAAVFPLSAAPAFTRAAIPGVSVAQQFAGRDFAIVVGVGVAASIGGVMAVEYLALSRLARALTSLSERRVLAALGAIVVVAAPITLINPERIYEDLIRPSLIALWLSQLIVFAVYPRFAARHRDRMVPAWSLTVIAVGLTLYGLWTSIRPAGS